MTRFNHNFVIVKQFSKMTTKSRELILIIDFSFSKQRSRLTSTSILSNTIELSKILRDNTITDSLNVIEKRFETFFC